jgi:hypothetical protein
MTTQETKMFCTLIRRSQVLRAERRALMTIIKRAVLKKEIPKNWKIDLAAIRKTPDYRAIVQELETTLVRLEQGADDADLLRLFEKLDEGKPPN